MPDGKKEKRNLNIIEKKKKRNGKYRMFLELLVPRSRKYTSLIALGLT